MATNDNTQKSKPLPLDTVPKNLNAKHCIIFMSGKGGVGSEGSCNRSMTAIGQT